MALSQKVIEYLNFFRNHLPIFSATFAVACFITGYLVVLSLSIKFGFDLGEYFGVSDYFLLPLNFLGAILSSLFLAIISVLSLAERYKLNGESKRKGIFQLLDGLFTWISLLLAILIFMSMAAPNISGEKERLNVHLKSNSALNCTSIIASNSQYFFLWDFSAQVARVIPKSEITGIEIVVPSSQSLLSSFIAGQQKKDPITGLSSREKFDKDRILKLEKWCK